MEIVIVYLAVGFVIGLVSYNRMTTALRAEAREFCDRVVEKEMERLFPDDDAEEAKRALQEAAQSFNDTLDGFVMGAVIVGLVTVFWLPIITINVMRSVWHE